MPRKLPSPPLDGVLVMNKPRGRTSHDVVEAVRRIVGFRQVGHLGTLDPIGTGVLVLLLGRATRLARFYAARRKRYIAAVRFGFATDTYDADGEPLGQDTAPELSREETERLAVQFVGRFAHVPPIFSAKKVHGRPAHELARKKKPVELKPVEVEVYEFQVIEVNGPVARLVIECAAGTYIRSLAHEMGVRLGCGAHLAEIVRTAVGEFTLDQAATIEELEEARKNGKLSEWVFPLERMLSELPHIAVLPIVERRVRHGARFNVQTAQIQPGRVNTAQGAPAELDSGRWRPLWLRVFNQKEKLIAIAEAIVPRTYQPVVVLDAEP